MSTRPVFSEIYVSAHIVYLKACIDEIADKIPKTLHIECYANSYRDALSNKCREIAWVQTLCAPKDYRIGILKTDMLHAQTLLQDRVAHSLTEKAKVLTWSFPASKDADIRSSIDAVRAIFRAFALKINQELEYASNKKLLAQAHKVMEDQIKDLNKNFPAVLGQPKTQGLVNSLSYLEQYRCEAQAWTAAFEPSRNFAVAVATFEKARLEEIMYIIDSRDIRDIRSILNGMLSTTSRNLADLEHDARQFNLNIRYQILSAQRALRKARKKVQN